MIIILLFALLPSFNAQRNSANIVTPSVWIYDELPSEATGRIKRFPNATVIIDGIIGQGIVMQCNVFNNPFDARIIWKRTLGTQIEVINDGLISRDMSRWFIGQGKQPNSVRLEILALDQSFEGTYSCESQYSGSVAHATVERYLRVLQAPLINRFQSSYATDVAENDRTVLQCNASGIPNPRIYWRRTGGSTSIIRNFGIEKGGNEIEFVKTQPEDAGEYVCMAENPMGKAIWRVQLRVRHKPVVKINPSQPIQKLGLSLMLMCDVLANPEISYDSSQLQWSNKAGLITNSSGRFSLKYLDAGPSKFLFLTIFSVTSGDVADTFTCIGMNTLGTTMRNTKILESPYPIQLLNGRLPSSGPNNNFSLVFMLISNSLVFYISKYSIS